MKPLVTKIIWFYYRFTDEKILKQQQQQQQQNLLNKTKQEQIKMRVFRNFSKYL